MFARDEMLLQRERRKVIHPAEVFVEQHSGALLLNLYRSAAAVSSCDSAGHRFDKKDRPRLQSANCVGLEGDLILVSTKQRHCVSPDEILPL